MGRDNLTRLLQRLFPEQAPAALQERIEKQTDPAILSAWFNLALSAASLDDFLARLPDSQ
jgi:hypothetical protein